MIIHQSDWMKITGQAPGEIEIDITGVIGMDDSWWTDKENGKNNTSDKMREELKKLAGLKAEKIIVNIDSLGGAVNHGLSIYQLLVDNKAQIETRVIGMTASIATVIAQAGDVRRMSESALMLVHEARSYAVGTAEAMKAEYESLIVVNNKAADIYAKKGGRDAQYYKDLMAKGLGEGVWMDSAEALEHGLIDEEFVTTRAAAVWGDDIFTKLNLKAPKMTKEKNKLSGFFAGLKSLIEGYKADNPEVEIPEAITAQMADFENRAQEVEAENVRLEGEITARVTEVQSLTAQITERDATITDLTSQVSAQTAEIERLTAEVEALRVAPITLEGDDPEPAPEDKPAENSFDADAAKIRAEFQVLRIEGAIPDDDK